MKKIGVIKNIDKLGRICIPKKMRELFGFEDAVEMVVTDEGLLLKNPEYYLVKKTNTKSDSK